MNFMHLCASFEIRADRPLSVRETARLYARKKLVGARSRFDTMASDEAELLLKSQEPATSGTYDPNVSASSSSD